MIVYSLADTSIFKWNGYSTDEDEKWPFEWSFLVFDMSFEQAKHLAKEFSQNAFLQAEMYSPVKLCCLYPSHL